MRPLLFAALFLAVTVWARAEVKVEPVFASDMVLQREMNTPIWGTADPGETVTVTFADQTKTAVADAKGDWMLKLDPMKASAEDRTLEIAGKSGSLKFDHVLVGDVWFCSGQSNMSFSVKRLKNADAIIAEANHPLIRLFGAAGFDGRVRAPRTNVSQHYGWAVCSPETVGAYDGYSAVAYLFGRDLQPVADIPIGLITVALGGSMAEAWIPSDVQAADPTMKVYLEAWDWVDAHIKELPKANPSDPIQYVDGDGKPLPRDVYGQSFQDWRHEWDRRKQAGQPIQPGFPPDFRRFMPHVTPMPDSMDRPGIAYDCMLAPLLRFGIKGVVWYQGEANAGSRDPRNYFHVMQVLMHEWRTRWGQGDFPFLIVQLPNFPPPVTDPVKGNWPTLREQQELIAEKIPNVSMAVTIDTGSLEGDPWHPFNKEPVAQRLALLAEKKFYGKDVIDSGPYFKSMTVEESKVRIQFTNPGGGLVATPLIQTQVPASASPDSELKGFAIAGEDQKWEWADAKVDGDSVIVWSDKVPKPVAVRYGWLNFPTCNLANKAGLPTAPFRTDDWPLVDED